MGLVACPSCAKEISDAAAACPACGHPMQRASNPGGLNLADPIHLIGVLLVLFFLIGAIAWGIRLGS